MQLESDMSRLRMDQAEKVLTAQAEVRSCLSAKG